jgi:hypothetical protein
MCNETAVKSRNLFRISGSCPAFNHSATMWLTTKTHGFAGTMGVEWLDREYAFGEPANVKINDGRL